MTTYSEDGLTCDAEHPLIVELKAWRKKHDAPLSRFYSQWNELGETIAGEELIKLLNAHGV